MKFGHNFDQISVPKWNLHNVDYNSLKREIKVHTTRNQAAYAIDIPGQGNAGLVQFEAHLYRELCAQHDRVALFVTNKADEITRRLEHLSASLSFFATRHHQSPPPGHATHTSPPPPPQQQQRQASRANDPRLAPRRYLKYEQDLVRCGEDIVSLQRFTRAQNLAFQKILRKHQKWTSSHALGERFRSQVLYNPASFLHRDYSHLQQQYDELSTRLQHFCPFTAEGTSSSSSSNSSTLDPTDSTVHSHTHVASYGPSHVSSSSTTAFPPSPPLSSSIPGSDMSITPTKITATPTPKTPIESSTVDHSAPFLSPQDTLVNPSSPSPASKNTHKKFSSCDSGSSPSEPKQAKHKRPSSKPQQEQQLYWNEYDHGSDYEDAGQDEAYAIYVQPDESDWTSSADIFGLSTCLLFRKGTGRFWRWSRNHKNSTPETILPQAAASIATSPPESQPLLLPTKPTHTPSVYLASDTDHREPEEDDDEESLFTSSYGSMGHGRGWFSQRPLAAHYGGNGTAHPFPRDSNYARLAYPDDSHGNGNSTISKGSPVHGRRGIVHVLEARERWRFWATLSSFVTSLILVGISSVLVATGRHKMKFEVNASVVVGIVASMLAACVGVGLSMATALSSVHGSGYGDDGLLVSEDGYYLFPESDLDRNGSGHGGGESWTKWIVVRVVFLGITCLNAMLLVVVTEW